VSEVLKNIINKIKKWKIKRKSEYILCPYCLYKFYEVAKWRGIYTIYRCNQCKALFKHNGKRIKGNRFFNKILKGFEKEVRETEIRLDKETNRLGKKYLISKKKIYQEGLNKILEIIIFGSE